MSAAVGEAATAYRCYIANKTYRATDKTKRRTTGKRKSNSVRRLLKLRDGNTCFYCGRHFGASRKATIEHLVSLNQGGPDHAANYALACEPCNGVAGHLSLMEKLAIRERRICRDITNEKEQA